MNAHALAHRIFPFHVEVNSVTAPGPSLTQIMTVSTSGSVATKDTEAYFERTIGKIKLFAKVTENPSRSKVTGTIVIPHSKTEISMAADLHSIEWLVERLFEKAKMVLDFENPRNEAKLRRHYVGSEMDLTKNPSDLGL
jgi:hypothetical protein